MVGAQAHARHAHLSYKKPAKCVKDLHSFAMQDANTRRLLLKLSWLMDKQGRLSAQTARLLAVQMIAWGRRGVKQTQLQGTVASSMVRGALDANRKTDAVLPAQPWPPRTHHVTSENGWAATTTLLQLTAALHDVMNPSKEGQSWALFWDMASTHASEATMAAMRVTFPHVVLCFIPPHSTSWLQDLHPRRMRAPLLPAPSSTAHSTVKPEHNPMWELTRRPEGTCVAV